MKALAACERDPSRSRLARKIQGATSSQSLAEKALQAVLAEMPHVLPFEDCSIQSAGFDWMAWVWGEGFGGRGLGGGGGSGGGFLRRTPGQSFVVEDIEILCLSWLCP